MDQLRLVSAVLLLTSLRSQPLGSLLSHKYLHFFNVDILQVCWNVKCVALAQKVQILSLITTAGNTLIASLAARRLYLPSACDWQTYDANLLTAQRVDLNYFYNFFLTSTDNLET